MTAPRLLAVMAERLALRHASPRTVEAYTDWVRRYVRFHVAGRVPGSFSTHQPTVTGTSSHEDAPLDRPFGFKVESTTTEPLGAG